MCTVGLFISSIFVFELREPRIFDLPRKLRAASSYLIAVMAILKRCRDRHSQSKSTALVNSIVVCHLVKSERLRQLHLLC